MKTIFFLLFCFTASVALAQNTISQKELLGTWSPSLIRMGDDDIVYDFKTDSFGFSPKLKATWRSAEDSTQTVMVTKMIFEALGRTKMTFGENNVYVETKPSGRANKGSYRFNPADGVLTTTTDESQTLKASKQGTQLCLQSEIKKGVTMRLFMDRQ